MLTRLKKLICKIDTNRSIFVFCIALITSIINLLPLFIGAAATPQGYKYIWVGVYYFDYFQYIQQIAQGSRGNWILENQFATDDPTKTIIGWGQYLIFGKIGKLFNFSPITTYWVFTFIFSLFLCVLIYILISRLLSNKPFYMKASAYILALFASPFLKIAVVQGKLLVVPFQFWNGSMTLFNRIGHVLHHLTSTLLTLIILLLIVKMTDVLKKQKRVLPYVVITGLLMVILLSFAPFQVVNILSGVVVLIAVIIVKPQLIGYEKRPIKPIVIFTGMIVVVIACALMIKFLHQSGELFARTSAWEIRQNFHPSLIEILLATGPILIFVPFGLREYLRSCSIIRLLFLFFVIFSFLFFLSPLAKYLDSHNFRFLSHLGHTLLAILSVLGLNNLASRFKLREKTVVLIALVLFILCFIPANLLTIQAFIQDKNLFTPVSYLPNGVFEGMKFLDREPLKKAILTSPSQPIGAILPTFIDKKVYLGRPLFTKNYEDKVYMSNLFYLGIMKPDEARDFLKSNDIGYVVLTSVEEYDPKNISQYDLKQIFDNKTLMIWKVLD